jgi:general secretion pathway protein K
MKALAPTRGRAAEFAARARRARMRALRKRRGVALILVLGAIVILTVFVTELQETSSATLSAAIAERDSEKAEYNAKSAINLSRLLIGSEPTLRQTLTPIIMGLTGGKNGPKQLPVWESLVADLVLGPFNDATHAQAFVEASGADMSQAGSGKNLGLGSDAGYFEVKIVDEDAKININSAAPGDPFSRQRLSAQLLGLMSPEQYTTMFEHQDQDGQFSDRATICGAIIDWSDYDEAFSACDPFGNAPQNDSAEDNFYQTVGLPYLRKNAPYDSLEELRLVRGVSDDFWSTFVDPDPNDPAQRVITVWGQGQINVNTANPQTLLAIVCAGAPEAKLCTDPVQMESFIMAVTLAKASPLMAALPMFGSPRMFTRAFEGKGSSMLLSVLTMLQIDPVTWRSAKEVQKAISVESKVFSIYADGVVPGRNKETRVRIHEVVDFRTAAALGATGTGGLGGLVSQLGGPPQAPAKTKTTSSSSSSEDAPIAPATDADVMAALVSDPTGNVIYYRIE